MGSSTTRLSSRRHQPSIIIVVGTAFSAALGLYLYQIDADKTAGLLCSLLSIAITLLLEMFSRLATLAKSVNHSLEMFRIYATRPPWLFSVTEQCVRAADATLAAYDHDMLQEAAQRYLEVCRDNLEDLSRGYMRVSSDDKRLSLRAIRSTVTSVRAVSIVRTDLPTWFTPSGERYLKENQAAASRGVAVERIFVYDKMTDDLAKLLRKLTFPNSKTYLLRYDRVPPDKRLDMVVFDNTFAVETRTNAEGEFVENVFSANASDIQRRVADFDFMKGLGEEHTAPPTIQAASAVARVDRQS